MEPIKIICRIKKNKNWFLCKYTPTLDKAISNFKSARTVRVINGICYIQHISLGYFTQILMRENVQITVITTLI